MDEKKGITIKKAAADLNVTVQTVSRWVRTGKLKVVQTKRPKRVDPAAAMKVYEEEAARPKGSGGKRSNWDAFTEELKASEEDIVTMTVDHIRLAIEAPTIKLEMLHYWDPYRAANENTSQGMGLRAVRAAGFELEAMTFKKSKNMTMLGAAEITFKRTG